MIRCSKCGTFYEEMSRSNCPKCGEKAHMSAGKCLLCGKEAERGDVCQQCISTYQIAEESHEQVARKKKSILAPLVGALISIACIVGLTMWILMPFRPSKETVSQEVYDNGEYAIKIINLYLDGVCTAEETRDKLEYFSYNNIDESSADDALLDTYVSGARLYLLVNDISKVKEQRNKIAELIGYKE